MSATHDPDGTRLPIKLDSATNGEFAPIPLAREHEHANALAQELATSHARHRGLSRREFMVSACGAASTLLAMNTAYAAAGRRGGFFDVPPEAALDAQLAAAKVDGNEFIFDVQGHFVSPDGAWTRKLPPGAKPLTFAPKAACALGTKPGERSYLQCLGPDEFVKDVFMDSDTDLCVLSFVPSPRDNEPLTIEEAAATARIVEKLDGTHRLFLHGRVNPNQPGDLDAMNALAERHKIAAWKTYTQFGPEGKGFFLDDAVGLSFIERARQLGVKNIAVHKGLPFGQQSYAHSTCVDIGRVAKRFPDVNFLVYHSGFVAGKDEGPYDASRQDGIDALITSLQQNDVKPGGNVYAELGSTWRFLMRDPTQAAHALGKLFKYVGDGNVLWGTDCIWYGSPQDQIQAFRTFQIAPELRVKQGYPEITPALRAKVFGLNALKVYDVPRDVVKQHVRSDRVARTRQEYRSQPDPAFVTYGPKTRREFLNLSRWTAPRP